MAALVYMKWKEGRLSFFGYKSAAGKRRELAASAPSSSPCSEKLEKDASLARSDSDDAEPVKETLH